jgi:hypothetical protein
MNSEYERHQHNRPSQRHDTNALGWKAFAIVGVILVVVALVTWAASANAADMRRSTKDVDAADRPFLNVTSAEPSSWTALWGAALAGYSMSNTELSFDIFGEGEEGPESFNVAKVDGFGGEGFQGDLQLGGDVQIGRFVVGAFGEYSFGGIESSASIFDGAGRLKVEQDDKWSILARAGITSGDTLFYVASGYTETTFTAKVSAGDDSSSRELDFSGIPLEFGVEHKFSPNVRGRLAGRYTWLDEETVFRFGDEEFGGKLNAEPGIFEIKAGVVITTGGLNVFGQ